MNQTYQFWIFRCGFNHVQLELDRRGPVKIRKVACGRYKSWKWKRMREVKRGCVIFSEEVRM